MGAAIVDGTDCLVAQRGPEMSLPGKWEFPGGEVEAGEAPRSALARELHEELQISVEVGDCLGQGESITQSARIVLDVYAARAPSRTITAGEHAQTRWLSANELPALDWAEADVPVIPAVQSRLHGCTEAHVANMEPVVLSVDWGKEPEKRAACVAVPADGWTLALEPPPSEGWYLATLLARARELGVRHKRPVLVGIDAVLGVPAAFARSFGCDSFPDVLAQLAVGGALTAQPTASSTWNCEQPFFRVAPGEGSLSRVIESAGGKGHLLRQIERRTGGNSVFVVSGIPGSVGSGSRALWSELVTEMNRAEIDFHLWPFDGTLAHLTREPGIVLAEVYPRAAYGIALADELPDRMRPLAKTKLAAREEALSELTRAPWLMAADIALPDLEPARQNEDAFDALFTAIALVRLVMERRPLSHELVDPAAEGGILGTGGILLPAADGLRKKIRQRTAKGTRSASGNPLHRCPIPGCSKVFASGRLGWDAHVGAYSRHPSWCPNVRDADQRKALFRQQFADWF